MIEERTHGLISLALTIAAGIVLGTLAVSAIFFILGAVVHLLAWLFHVALIVGMVALAWWLLVGRRRHRYCGKDS